MSDYRTGVTFRLTSSGVRGMTFYEPFATENSGTSTLVLSEIAERSCDGAVPESILGTDEWRHPGAVHVR